MGDGISPRTFRRLFPSHMAPYREEHGAPVAFLTGNVDADLVSGFLSYGYKLILAGELKSIAQSFHDSPVSVVELNFFGSETEINEAVQKAWNVYQRLDVLLFVTPSNAPVASVLELDENDWDKFVSGYLKAAWLLSKCVATRMRDHGTPGSIVFVTSIAGAERGLFPGTSAHAACVAGIQHLAKVMSLEVGKFKIRVNAVVRGFCKTDGPLQLVNDPERYAKLLPLQRWAQGGGGFASVVLLLAGLGGSFITGTTIFADGGQSLVRPRMRGRL